MKCHLIHEIVDVTIEYIVLHKHGKSIHQDLTKPIFLYSYRCQIYIQYTIRASRKLLG